MIKRIELSFNRAALTYDQNSIIQKTIGKKLIKLLLPHVQQTEMIIDLGCGTGLITEQLALSLDFKNFFALDLAEQLLIKARKRLAYLPINFLLQNFETFLFKKNHFNLIFSNMALQWAIRFEKTLQNIKNSLSAQSLLAFSVPLQGTFQELILYQKNKFYSLDRLLKIIAKMKFRKIVYFMEQFILSYPSWLIALQSIKAVGANATFCQTKKSLHGKNQFKRKLQCLTESKPAQLTYNIGYFLVWK